MKYSFWRNGDYFPEFLNDYPEYQTQAYSKQELIENLHSLLEDIRSGISETQNYSASLPQHTDNST